VGERCQKVDEYIVLLQKTFGVVTRVKDMQDSIDQIHSLRVYIGKEPNPYLYGSLIFGFLLARTLRILYTIEMKYDFIILLW